MLAGRLVVLSSLEELPEEAAVDRESCRLMGVKSNLRLPLSVGGEPPVGCLGLITLLEQRLAALGRDAAAAGRAGLHQRPRPEALRAGPAGERGGQPGHFRPGGGGHRPCRNRRPLAPSCAPAGEPGTSSPSWRTSPSGRVPRRRCGSRTRRPSGSRIASRRRATTSRPRSRSSTRTARSPGRAPPSGMSGASWSGSRPQILRARSRRAGRGKELSRPCHPPAEPRRSHLLVKVKCAALPSGLVRASYSAGRRGPTPGP